MDSSESDEILEIHESARLIEYLFHKNLFIFSVGEQAFRYHALFRDLLLKQFQAKAAAYTQLHERAAGYFEQRKQYERAIPHLLAIRDYSSLASILQSYGRSMLENDS